MESLNSEMTDLINYMGWDDEVDWLSSVKEKAIRKRQVHPTLSRQEITATYFHYILPEDRMKVYEIYKYDFLLFGYSPDPKIIG